MITYIADKMRILLGDSRCPLYFKCSGADETNDTCESNRGREEIGGARADCYKFFKSKIREAREGLLSRVSGRIVEGISKAEGIEDE